MALSIKNAETEALARKLAARTGTSMTGAITDALRGQLEALEASDGDVAAERLAKMKKISLDASTRWPHGSDGDPSSWLYDDRGLPA